MSALKARLSDEMKTAMKSGEKERLSFARNLHAAVRKKEIDDRVDLDDAAFQKIAQTLIKQRQDSIEQFKAGGRQDLVTKEEAELAFLKTFMPEEMSADEVKKLVDWAVTEAKAAGPKDLGAVMKLLMPKTQGKADGKLVSQLVKERLG
jgi:uncharacterized protein YqeY